MDTKENKPTIYPTCDAYVLSMLQKREEENSKLHEHIRQLNTKIDELTHSKEKTERHYIDIDNKLGVYYHGRVESQYEWNDWLKQEKKTPEYIDELVANEAEFKKYLKDNNNGWNHKKLWEIDKHTYYKLITTFKGRTFALYDSYDGGLNIIELDGRSGLNFQEVYQAVRKEFLDAVAYYKKNYAPKFEPEPTTTENK